MVLPALSWCWMPMLISSCSSCCFSPLRPPPAAEFYVDMLEAGKYNAKKAAEEKKKQENLAAKAAKEAAKAMKQKNSKAAKAAKGAK